MHKVTITSPVACVLFILTACCFTEIGDGREIQNDGSTSIKTPTQGIQSSGSMFFFSKLHVHIPNHVIRKIVTNIEILNFSILAKFFEYVFVEILEVLLKFPRIRLLNVPVLVYTAVKASVGGLIHIRKQQSLAGCRPVVKTRTAVTMATHTNLKVKGTIDTIFLSPKDGRQMLRHGGTPKLPLKD